MTTGVFRARILLGEEDVLDVEVWDDELTPTKDNHRSVREWVKEHLDDWDRSQFIELLPPHDVQEDDADCYEILFTGKIVGFYSGYPGEEDYEEYVEETQVQYQSLGKGHHLWGN